MPPVLRQLLTFASSEKRPDLGVILVDSDGNDDRKTFVESALVGIPLPHVVAVPIQEFESWLIADHRAVVSILAPAPNQPSSIEKLDPHEAKSLLGRWISAASGSPAPREVRLTLAQTCDLGTLDRLSAFRVFRDELRSRLNQLQGR
ncbi:MAG TPA: hypothetical protein VFH68_12760 [Polyangia bacterium]|nr:hypothetical protein [Polyangia bacterium]